MRYNDGFIIGAGAARNIDVGFVPSAVRILNLTDNDEIFDGALYHVIPFDSGGGTVADPREIKAGHEIVGPDGAWGGTVFQVILSGGAWSAGTAAGFIVLAPGSEIGVSTIADNNIISVRPQQHAPGAGDFATVNGANFVPSLKTSGATITGPDGERITPWNGGEAGSGFSIGPGMAADNRLLFYQCWAPDPVGGPIDMSRG